MAVTDRVDQLFIRRYSAGLNTHEPITASLVLHLIVLGRLQMTQV
jgi:hypothetical protein